MQEEVTASHWQVVVFRVSLVVQVGAGLPGPPHAKHGPVPFAPCEVHVSCAAVSPGYNVLQYLAHELLPPPPPPLAAQAVPGKEASAPPTRAAPISLSALPRVRLPLASPLASSSKELSLVSLDIGCLLPEERESSAPPCWSTFAL